MKTVERSRASSPELGVQALIEEARRRQRRRRGAIALVLVAVVGIGLAVLASVGGPGRAGATRRDQPSRGSLLPGADTSVLMWPAGAAVFGDLPGGGSGTTVQVDNLSTGQVSLRRVPGIAGGDFSYALMPVGRWLVYNSGLGVSAIADDLDGSPRFLGGASWFVPSTVRNTVLLVQMGASGLPRSVRSASVSSGLLGPAITLPRGAQQVIESTRRGLLLLFTTRESGGGYTLDLWRPGRLPAKLAYLSDGSGVAFGVSARSVAFGSSCASEEATVGFPNGPAGYSACATLRVIDVVNGRVTTFPAPPGTLGWVPGQSQSALETAIAPSGALLAAQAALAPASSGRTRLFVLRLGDAHKPPTAVPSSTAREGANFAWSIHGSWLLYPGPSSNLSALSPTGSARMLTMRCCQAAAMVTVPSE